MLHSALGGDCLYSTEIALSILSVHASISTDLGEMRFHQLEHGKAQDCEFISSIEVNGPGLIYNS